MVEEDKANGLAPLEQAAVERELMRATPPANGERQAQAVDAVLRRAATEGLIDVAYTVTDSPLGPLLLATTRRGLVRVAYDHGGWELVLSQLADWISPRVLKEPARLDLPRQQLEEFFQGRRREFDLPLDWSLTRGFRRAVLRATAAIEYGRVATYGEVAARIRHPGAARAAGSALAANPLPIVVPCHRVVRTGGAIGEYGGGSHRKHALLRLEGAIS